MERLWAPWRMEFILNEKPPGCIFCLGEKGDRSAERERLVLLRDRHTFIMMNRYPYSNGHLLVSPNRHIADMGDLADEEMLELFGNVGLCCRVISRVMSSRGSMSVSTWGRPRAPGLTTTSTCTWCPAGWVMRIS